MADRSGYWQVWVLEIAILHASRNEISHWDIWQAYNTRGEAVDARNASTLPRKFWRIRKYIPAEGSNG